MIRHPANTNLSLYSFDTYKGYPIQVDKGPFIQEYLETLHQTVQYALMHYNRVFAFRIDLRLPAYYDCSVHASNVVMSRFVESFKAKIKHNRQKALSLRPYAHDSVVRYVWAREFGEHGRPHYHMAFLLNYDAFNALGDYSSGRSNIANRLKEAWASALDISLEQASGLVQYSKNGTYVLRRDADERVAEFFYRASYLCKEATKAYGDGSHSFGASRG